MTKIARKDSRHARRAAFPAAAAQIPFDQQVTELEMFRRRRGLSDVAANAADGHGHRKRHKPHFFAEHARFCRAIRQRLVPPQRGAGVALALLEEDSASRAYTLAIEPQNKIQASSEGWRSVPCSEAIASTMNFGLNHVVNKHMTINGSGAIGLTPDAPNFVVDVRLPQTF